MSRQNFTMASDDRDVECLIIRLVSEATVTENAGSRSPQSKASTPSRFHHPPSFVARHSMARTRNIQLLAMATYCTCVRLLQAHRFLSEQIRVCTAPGVRHLGSLGRGADPHRLGY
jgi:hypothetical protein